MNPSVGPGSSNAVTARPADLRARKCHESGLRPNPVGGIRPDGGVRPDGGRGHGEAEARPPIPLRPRGPTDEEGRPPELLGPRLSAAPVGWRCVTPEPEFLEWPESLDAAEPRGEHHPRRGASPMTGVVVVSKGQEHGLSFHSSVLPSPKTKIAISPPTNSIYRGPGAPKSGTPCTAIWGSPSRPWTTP